MLGSQLKESGLDGCVPAWHGYAHNRLCQLTNHPLYREGFGMNDFEGCERLFSSTNGVARCTRHASSRYRHQMLCSHFEQWDEDKYRDLSLYLLRHYKEALGRQAALSTALSKAETLLDVRSSDFDGWLAEEREYLQNLVKEPTKNIQDIMYLELPAKYYKAKEVWDDLRKDCVIDETAAAQSSSYSELASDALRIESKRRTAMDRLLLLTEAVNDMELKLGMTPSERWHPSHPRWVETSKYMKARAYKCALDKLELLVVQRLFEMEKLNMRGTGRLLFI
ncbi:hypothetical protein BOTBODRAFT_116704 [Botryobasidium botryosum FD-172 SS1]|uniref:CxC1-like cysteine cluster associated with KDZ transposases domain-containing protein n=1 Tax=Botryobasidium botryosum (strain FD-172 SS1) TaxID=930990 RepID=A0A067M2L8_BOTB1|nr:hypothetical protein BOTBODRAFT_116704 [Botryobasidium botryosum FD-172 SS1]